MLLDAPPAGGPRRAAGDPPTAGAAIRRRDTPTPPRAAGRRGVVAGAVGVLLALAVTIALLPALQLGLLPRPPAGAGGTPTPSGTATPTAGPSYTAERAEDEVPDLMLAAGLDALSPELAEYVAGVARGGTAIGVDVYDVTRGRTYAYNQDASFTLASSAKVYILCAYLDRLEKLGRAPNATERAEMYAMITRSDNNAAQWLYNRLGGAGGQQRFLQGIGIAGYVPGGYSWGYAQLSPAGMVRVLTLLQAGRILTDDDREYALGLMGRVDLGRWGVGDTAPRGAQVYMKDGWVTGPDGRWAQNSSGIVVAGGETYIVSVYTQHLPRYDWSAVRHVCAAVADALT